MAPSFLRYAPHGTMEWSYELAWLDAFLFTQVVEVPIYFLALQRLRIRPRWLGRPLPASGQLMLAILLSALTHPVVWFVWPRLVPSYPVMVACAEIFAFGTEALVLAACGCRWGSLPLSICANGASFGLGELGRAVLKLP
jgi:hypothetical protein